MRFTLIVIRNITLTLRVITIVFIFVSSEVNTVQKVRTGQSGLPSHFFSKGMVTLPLQRNSAVHCKENDSIFTARVCTYEGRLCFHRCVSVQGGGVSQVSDFQGGSQVSDFWGVPGLRFSGGSQVSDFWGGPRSQISGGSQV